MLNAEYWQSRYEGDETGWDIAYASPPIVTYFETLSDTSLKILIPGCGNAYEAAYLFEKGFTNTYLLDWAEAPLEQFAEAYPAFPKSQLLKMDFFSLNESFDLIIEQTFFCAIDPSLRKAYVSKCAEILSQGGKLSGLLFNTEFEKPGPPFGGNVEEYKELFSSHFEILQMNPAENSIQPRAGREVFVEFQKK